MVTRASRGLRAVLSSSARVLRRIVLPPLPERRLPRLAVVALYYVSVVGALRLAADTDVGAPVLGVCVTAAWYVGVARKPWWRIVRWTGAVLTILIFLCFLGFSCVIFPMFEWAAPWWLRLAQGTAAVLVLVTVLPRNCPVRIPAVLLLALCCVVGLAAGRERGVLRCNDYLRVRAQPGVEVLIPSVLEELSCRAGDVLNLSRYPRNSWEAVDGQRFLLTLQDVTTPGYGRAVAPRFTGSICEVRVDPDAPLHCFGTSIGSEIIDAPEDDRVFAFHFDKPDYGGTLWAFTRDEPLRVAAVRHFPTAAAAGYYDPGYDLLAIFSESQGFDFLHPGDLTPAGEPLRERVEAGQIHYDARRHAGVLCQSIGFGYRVDGQAFLSLAYTGWPFQLRRLGPSERYPWAWVTAVWGCDWDPDASIVWIAIANLGIVVPIDYDTGSLLPGPYPYIGIGARTVLYDKPRRRLYISKWTTGEVLAISIDSGEILRRWFAGRWVRGLAMSRDQRSILLSANVGLVRIAVDF